VARQIASRQPLPVRDGVGASVIVVPEDAPQRWANVLAFLQDRFAHIPADALNARLARGDIRRVDGSPLDASTACTPGERYYYYREIPDEANRLEDETIVFEDELLIVADKPHFMPVTPGGRYLQETLLVRLRRRLQIDDLAPMHRIDRETAGLVVFTKRPETRGRYQALFDSRDVRKTYLAIASVTLAPSLPLRARHCIVAAEHFMQMRVSEDPSASFNAECDISLDLVLGSPGLARYRLQPLTGKKHQLRVQMAALGAPIIGDQIYPDLVDVPHEDPEHALQLLAQSLSFVDPINGIERHFETTRTLREV
jgi:tRNA pseudouridine32 synthase / 23S rRNA pseudouridine746 synthase